MTHTEQIPKWELDTLRDALVGFYTHHCRVEGYSPTDDAYGGTSETRSVRSDLVPCYVEGGVAHEQDRVLVEGLIRETEFFTISMPAYTEVYVNDYIIVYDDPNDLETGNWEVKVTAVIGPESHEIERRVLGYRTP